MPAGQLQSVFRCARCQYRVPGTQLVDEARISPPKWASNEAPVLGPLDEDSDDQHTRVLMPGGPDDESETPLGAVLVPDGSVSSHPPPNAPLQRFETESADGDDQQTRMHVPGSFEPPGAARPPARSAPPALRPSPSPPARGPAGLRDATLLGVPAAPVLGRFDSPGADSDDQTRMHLPDDFSGSSRSPLPLGSQPSRGQPSRGQPLPHQLLRNQPLRDQTLIGVAPASPLPDDEARELQRFDRVEEDAEDQHTRLQVPISYEADDEAQRAVAPSLRPLVAPKPISARAPSEVDALPQSGMERFGSATLQLSRSIEEWLHERQTVLLITLATLSGLVAPVLDALLHGPRHGVAVIVSNLVLFFLWTLAFAWLGKLRNEAGEWDPSVAWTRASTTLRLAFEDLAGFGSLPGPLRYRVLGELAGIVGFLGLGVASVLTISQLVWGWPGATGGVLTGRVWGAALIAISVIALRRASSVPVGYIAPPEIAAPAVAHFPAVLDLSVPVNLNAHGGMTQLHQVLEVLAEWEPREWPNQDSYIAALERHLLRRMGWARVERERWLGPQRSEGVAHFVVNESLLIEVIRGFDADTAERTSARMRSHARVWRGKPALIVAFDASRSSLFAGAGTPTLEALHQSYPMLTVRMPSARLSLA